MFNTLSDQQHQFISDLSNAIDIILDERLNDTLAVENIEILSNEVIRNVLSVLEGGEAAGYHVVPTTAETQLDELSLSAGIVELFDEINS